MRNIIRIAREIYRIRYWREAHRAAVFLARACLHHPAVNDLLAFFERDPVRQDILAKNKFPIEQATRAFFYKGSTFSERVALIKTHFALLQEKLCDAAVRKLYQGGRIPLWNDRAEGADWRAELASEAGQRKEGLLSIVMQYDGLYLYQIIFWLGKDKRGAESLFIGALQGSNVEGAKDLVKEATKRAHRYRTKNLILYMAQAVARLLGLAHIYAVTNEGYYAQNHIRRDRKLKTDFAAFWQEAGGHATNDKRFYELPLVESRKTMEEVPTRKRAVYRKRFAFQEDADAQIKHAIQEMARNHTEHKDREQI